MLPITSGTSTERIVRSLLLSLMVDVFAVYFLYDGYVGYPQANADQLAKLLGAAAAQAPAPNSAITAERGRNAADALRPGETLDKLIGEFGPSAYRDSGAAYFLGPGGWLKADLDADRVRALKWFDAPHSEADMLIQRILGWTLLACGVVATLNLARVLSTRAQLSDEGLRVSGRGVVPFDAMTGLRPPNTKSQVSELDFTVGSRPQTLRLDPYMYKEADAIAQAIAERKGFAAPSTTA